LDTREQLLLIHGEGAMMSASKLKILTTSSTEAAFAIAYPNMCMVSIIKNGSDNRSGGVYPDAGQKECNTRTK